MNKANLKEIFMGLQAQMIARLRANRAVIQHPGTKGDTFELNWIEWLRDYLPKRYCVDKGFIIDCEGSLSDQIDVVVYDRQYSPFVFNQDGALYIPAESVYAIFEVKPELSKAYIEYAGEKAKSVRQLKRTSAPIYHAAGCYEPKLHAEILAGILALSSTWSPALGESFEETVLGLSNERILNLGCALEAGAFQIVGQIEKTVNKSSEQETLIFFFLKLLIELQKLGTIPAMDINCYAAVLDSFN